MFCEPSRGQGLREVSRAVTDMLVWRRLIPRRVLPWKRCPRSLRKRLKATPDPGTDDGVAFPFFVLRRELPPFFFFPPEAALNFFRITLNNSDHTAADRPRTEHTNFYQISHLAFSYSLIVKVIQSSLINAQALAGRSG